MYDVQRKVAEPLNLFQSLPGIVREERCQAARPRRLVRDCLFAGALRCYFHSAISHGYKVYTSCWAGCLTQGESLLISPETPYWKLTENAKTPFWNLTLASWLSIPRSLYASGRISWSIFGEELLYSIAWLLLFLSVKIEQVNIPNLLNAVSQSSKWRSSPGTLNWCLNCSTVMWWCYRMHRPGTIHRNIQHILTIICYNSWVCCLCCIVMYFNPGYMPKVHCRYSIYRIHMTWEMGIAKQDA